MNDLDQRIAIARGLFARYAVAAEALAAFMRGDPEAAVAIYADLAMNRPGNAVSLAATAVPTAAYNADAVRDHNAKLDGTITPRTA